MRLAERLKRRGNLLMMTLALAFIMVTLVAALHHYESVSRRAIFASEAELQLRQARRWELGAQLHKLPPGARPSAHLTMAGNTAPVVNNVTIGAGCAGNLFTMASNSSWSGLPDLSITRLPADTNTTANMPPAFTEYQVRPTSSNPALNVFSRRMYREVVTSLPPYAAYAPSGSIRMDSCVGWSNPAFAAGDNPLDLYSGLPCVLAAGQNLTVANMPYGVAYATCVTVQQGLALPLPARFPVRPYEDALVTNISTQMGTLVTTAQSRDSEKTNFINGAAPSPSDLLGLIGGDPPNFEGYLSLNASLNFPFPVIPGFTTVTYPLCYFAFQFWFHAPYPPDGGDDGTDTTQLVQDLADELEALQRKQAKLQHALDGFKGTNGVAGSTDTLPDHSGPDETGTVTVGTPSRPAQPGLVERSDALLEDLRADLATVQASNSTAPVTTGLRTDQSLFSWTADFSTTGYSQELPAGLTPKATVPAGNIFSRPLTAAERARLNYNQGLLDSSKDIWPSPSATDTSLPPPRQQYNNTDIQPDAAITSAQWGRMIDPNWELNHRGLPDSASVNTTRADQVELLKFLTDVTNPDNPFAKAKVIRDRLQPEYDDVTQQIADKRAQITETFDRIQEGSNRTVPDRRLNDIVGRAGQSGFSYSRFGYSYDFFFNLMKNLVTGDFSNWEPSWPLVFYGRKENARMPLTVNNAFTVTGTFTVPQNRTFYYANPMTVRGDLWLQRGSTLVVGRNLNVEAPSAAAGSPTSMVDRMNFFRPCGRIFLEEGASLIVQGDLVCTGTLERGSIIVTGPAGAVHPITSGIHATGRVVAPYGIYNGLGLNDMLPALGLETLNRAVYAGLAYVAPNLAKAWGPFHRRNPFFASKCTAYQLVVAIGPFGIPIPILTPFPVPPRSNAWVALYRGLSLFYATVDNVNLGENLYPQADWWPGGAGTDLCGIVPIAPKLDPRSVLTSLANMSVSIPTGSQLSNFASEWVSGAFQSLFTYVAQELFTTLVKKLLVGMLPAGSDALLTPVLNQLNVKDGLFDQGDTNSTPLSRLADAMSGPIGELQTKVGDWLVGESQDAVVDALAREVAGVLVSGRSISIGMNPATGQPLDPPPFLASGMFVATGDIRVNTLYTVGTLVSRDGSIDTNRLLYYPYHGQGSLFKPVTQPAIEARSPLKDLRWAFLKHAGNYQYGTLGDPGTGLDFGAPGVTHVTAEGWQQ